MPELYRFVKDSLDCNPMLIYCNDIVISAEGSQQGDSLRGLEFCKSIQPNLLETGVRTTTGFVDDINMKGEVSSVASDVQAIIDSNPTMGLVLNASNCDYGQELQNDRQVLHLQGLQESRS